MHSNDLGRCWTILSWPCIMLERGGRHPAHRGIFVLNPIHPLFPLLGQKSFHSLHRKLSIPKIAVESNDLGSCWTILSWPSIMLGRGVRQIAHSRTSTSFSLSIPGTKNFLSLQRTFPSLEQKTIYPIRMAQKEGYLAQSRIFVQNLLHSPLFIPGTNNFPFLAQKIMTFQKSYTLWYH